LQSGIGQIRTYLKARFDYAMDEDLIEKNPTRKLDMPNIRKKSCDRFLTVDELRALLSHAAPREHLVLRILAVCGLRPAEILVLRIEDFEGTQLRIDEALKERQRGKDRIGVQRLKRATTTSQFPQSCARDRNVDCRTPRSQ
jgi:integrase